MGVVEVNLGPANIDAHEGESLGREAIGFIDPTKLPGDAVQTSPLEVGERIQARTRENIARGHRPVGMVVLGIYLGVVAEIFLDVDNIVCCLGKETANSTSIGGLVPRHAVVAQPVRETSYVEGQEAEGSRRLGEGEPSET